MFEEFKMVKAKLVGSPLAGHSKLKLKQSPSSENENEEIENIHYASAI